MKVSQIRRLLQSYSELRGKAGDDSGADALARLAGELAPLDDKQVKAAVDGLLKRRDAIK